MKSMLKPLAYAVAMGVVFGAGVLVDELDWLPQPVKWRVAAVKQGVDRLAKRYVKNPQGIIAAQKVKDAHPAGGESSIDTALLPLRISSIRLSDHYALAKLSGGMAQVRGKAVVVDRLGGFFGVVDGKAMKYEFPPLPNHIEEFVKYSKYPLNDNTLRVQDVEYLADDHALAVAHEYFDPDSHKTCLAVSLIPIDEATLRPAGTWRTVFRGNLLELGEHPYFGLAGGGRLLAKGKGVFYLTSGDYNLDGVILKGTPKVAQNPDPNSYFGKILEIDYANDKVKVVSIGNRNSQGLMLSADGRLFTTEHGPQGGDELNWIRQGGNYGWPEVTLGTHYGVYSWPHAPHSVGEHDGYLAPAYAWVPSVGISSLIQVQGFDRRWDGDFLVGSLKGQTLFRLRFDRQDPGKVIYAEPIWIGQRIRDIVQLDGQTIALWTDDAQVMFLGVDRDKLAKDRRSPELASDPVLSTCMVCHHFGPTKPTDYAPSLSNLFGRKIAADSYEHYSAALKAKEGEWTEENLRAFIQSPGAFASGSKMPDLDKSVDVGKIVERLREAGSGQ